jgi:tripartite-type tricarboxylate transporter receptor subunit TctC
LVVCCAIAGSAVAQANWPSKPITLVAPTAPGSDGDIMIRALAQKMTQLTGVSVVTDNKPGASGTLGVTITSHAAPDGYTAVITGTGPFILQPLLNKQLPYNMEKTLVPVSLVSTFASAVVVAGDSPYKTLGELIAAARAQPGKLTFATSGQGTLVHLSGELLKIRAGVDLLHVPYKSQAPGVQAVLSQEATLMIAPSASLQKLIESGKLRALAVTSSERMGSLPNVPTMAEAGVKDFVVTGWYGAYAPAGTPRPLAERLSAEIRRALADREVKEKYQALGMEAVGSTPDQLHATWKADTAIWDLVLKANPQVKLEQ